jgi:conjugative transfer pilus assembly protein TraH
VRPRRHLGKTFLFATLGCLALAPMSRCWAGDLQAEVDSMFNNLGTIGNYTAPGAFRGQTYNTYTGGSIFLRSPNKVYQLATIQFPYVKAGCGGIDVFGGSFSHLAATEFKDMLKSITAALPGVAFQLALSAVTPLLGQKAEWAKSLETFITNARINSCETASALVRGAANQLGFDSFSSCIRIAIELGQAPDEDGARRLCRSSQDATLAAGAASGNADARAMVPFTGNLTWQALKLVNSIDDNERQLIMSMVGTTVYYPTSQNRDPDVIGPTLTSITQLLYGNADAGNGNVTITLLNCSDFTDCTTVNQNTAYVLTPFTTKAEQIMTSISDKIATRSAAPSPAEIGFVNITSEPVYRMLSIGNAIKGSGLAETLIIKYRDVVAIDYAYNFLETSLKLGLDALAKDFKLDTHQMETAKELRDRVRSYLTSLALEKQSHYAKVQAFNSVASHLEQLERQLRSSMPQHVIDMLGQNGLSMASR